MITFTFHVTYFSWYIQREEREHKPKKLPKVPFAFTLLLKRTHIHATHPFEARVQQPQWISVEKLPSRSGQRSINSLSAQDMHNSLSSQEKWEILQREKINFWKKVWSKFHKENFLFNFIIWHLINVHCPTIYVTSWVQPSQCHWTTPRLLVLSVSSLQFRNATIKKCFRLKLGT